MKIISLVVSCLTLLAESSAQSDESGYPGGLGGEIWSLLTNGTIQHFFGCKSHDNITQDDIVYYLYNRENPNRTALTLNNLSDLDASKPLKIIFTGWLGRSDDPLLLNVVNAYLTRYDCNVIFVDTIKLTNTQYTQAYCNIIFGGEMVGDFLCEMHQQGYLNFSDLHMVGVSLGAHIMGIIGQRVQKQCNQKVDRITGLDPAGPIFQGQDIAKRLDPSDANFVDVIHTNMGMFGYYGSVGHVDFFPNCGSAQPNCIQLEGVSNPLVVLLTFINCSHVRSAELFAESIHGPVFNGTSCTFCPDSHGIGKCKGPDIIKPKYAIMGEDCPRNPSAKKFVLKTNKKSPYAKG